MMNKCCASANPVLSEAATAFHAASNSGDAGDRPENDDAYGDCLMNVSTGEFIVFPIVLFLEGTPGDWRYDAN